MSEHTCGECAFFKKDNKPQGLPWWGTCECPLPTSHSQGFSRLIQDDEGKRCPAFQPRDREDAVKRLVEAAKHISACREELVRLTIGYSPVCSCPTCEQMDEAIAAVEAAVKEVEHE